MNDGKLSQDEIDALLKVGEDEAEDAHNTSELLSTTEQDTLGEIGNISFGSSATTLSTLLNQKVEITTPEVSVITKDDFHNEMEQVSIHVNYSEGFNGQNVLLMKSDDAAVISDIMLGGDGTTPDKELQEIHLSAIQEVMNQMMGTAATSMSTVFEKRIDISPPAIRVEKGDNVQSTGVITDEDYLVKVSFHLQVGHLIDSNIMQVIPLSFARQLVEQLMEASSDESRQEAAVTAEVEKTSDYSHRQQSERIDENQNPQYLGDKLNSDSSSIQQAAFSDLEQADFNHNEKRNLDMLLDIPLKVSVELGRTQRSIKDILELSAGAVVELDKLAGEPVDILVNEKLIAKGEVVVIDENFGVRVTDIISQSDRLLKLK
ncbi:flagellar motor switch protein FliN/FliY [Lentibacillus halodurans]|uniref:Flagellar motor switch protein FliN/FliY n=1 Tax=Lentibacillus halodurans TaxID=237679 RepID=A0A1I0VM18_9BACI|nr:flagellar motor switch phosphatase FliY [Lentibacillus halodurans]SFA77464.1 flagellar motor switch protein FliN/FliY [Lentibacillus halodurans]